jgi:soluble lytic murein transglycosylase
VKSRLYALFALCCVLVWHRTIAAQEDRAEQAGALLAAGQAGAAADAARACGTPRCELVRGRALFGLGRLSEAAAALAGARPGLGPLQPHAAVLQGEALLLAGRTAEALEPLQAAAGDKEGPPGLRGAALLADALLQVGDPAAARAQAERAAALQGQPSDVRAGMAWNAAQALALEARQEARLARQAAEALRGFWLSHPEHPAAEAARAEERALAVGLQEPTGRELMLRAGRLLAAGQPAAAVAQSEVAAQSLQGEDRAEAQLLHARAMAADGKRAQAGPWLEQAWADGAAHVASQAGMLLARDRARKGSDREAIQLADAVAKKFPAAPEAEESVLFTARLLADSGRRAAARARLAKLAAKRSGPNASAARWTLAWMSYQDHLRDAPERFAEFAASAAGDEERAQGTYWQARSGKRAAAEALLQRAAELDPLGWYGLLARERLGLARSGPVPFPPPLQPIAGVPAARLALGLDLAALGLLAEAAAEADWFVQRHPGDAGAAALPLYERAGRYDRSVLLAEALLGGRGARAPKPLLDAAHPAAFPAEVARSTQRTRIDPYLLLSVIRRESLFKPDTRSSAGAVGLLQLLPATARRAAAVLGRPPLRDDELTHPETAIDLGSWYLSELLGRFGDPAVALAAYNAGPRVATPWAARGAGRQLDEWVEDIPYRETRRYVKVVIGAWSAYRILAGGTAPTISATVPTPKSGANF